MKFKINFSFARSSHEGKSVPYLRLILSRSSDKHDAAALGDRQLLQSVEDRFGLK
jgi:hypothetical protein